jgi:3-hydroxy-9,10-secoandrosta-1,3,5(10)-triene-9,17-dione monooxygenase reductase component
MGVDARQFRNALGQFATGVTIVTTVTEDGEPAGLTANSFNSASIDPPLVLWSLGKSSSNLEAFTKAEFFAVNILSDAQQDLSNRFATVEEGRFDGVVYRPGVGGAPLLPGCAARFQCKTSYQYEGGDHIIFVGEVLEFDNFNRPPLIFHSGNYAAALAVRKEEQSGGYVDDFLMPLLARTFRYLSGPIYARVEAAGLTRGEFRVLACLSDSGFTPEALGRIIPMDSRSLESDLGRLSNRGLLRIETKDDGLRQCILTPEGSATVIELLAQAKAAESDVFSDFSKVEQAQLKEFLRRLTDKMMGTP